MSSEISGLSLSLASTLTADEIVLQTLIEKQRQSCPKVIAELQSSGRKTGHWAWWVFPTEKAGFSEPGPKTYVTSETAISLLNVADMTCWKDALTLTTTLMRDKGMNNVLPPIDHGRVEYFFKFWVTVDAKPQWMMDALDCIKSQIA
jgi:hypothetical protein